MDKTIKTILGACLLYYCIKSVEAIGYTKGALETSLHYKKKETEKEKQED